MKVLTRYVLRLHLAPFLFAFLTLFGVVLINTLAERMADLAGKGIPARVFLEFFVLSLPSNIALTLPMAVLVAVLHTFSQLAAENEITAMEAAGVDLRRVAMPILGTATMIALAMVWFNDRVLPAANHRWGMLMMDVAQTTPLLLVREHVMNPITSTSGATRHYLQASRADPATGRLRDVAIYDVSNPDVSRTIFADSGVMLLDQLNSQLALTLFDGHVREVDLTSSEGFQRVGFTRQVMRIDGVDQRLERNRESSYRDDREMTVAMLHARADTFRAELSAARSDRADHASFQEARIDSLEGQIRELSVEVHKKYAIAVATLVFVLIGIPAALRFRQGGMGMVMGVSVSVFAVYYVGLKLGEDLGNRGYVHPVLAMWGTNLFFGAIGIAATWSLGRTSGSNRSGPLESLVARIFHG